MFSIEPFPEDLHSEDGDVPLDWHDRWVEYARDLGLRQTVDTEQPTEAQPEGHENGEGN